jgi:two-component system LytT family response regulator
VTVTVGSSVGQSLGGRETARTLSVVIVDDERLARQRLRRLLGAMPGVEVVAECALGGDAVEVARRLRPDVMLLDIQMPDVDGFGALERLLDAAEGDGYDASAPTTEVPHVPLVIFVTAFDEYALRAFDVHAVDYVLKPVDEARLAEAIDRARTTLRTHRLAEAHERLLAATEALMRSRARTASNATPESSERVDEQHEGSEGGDEAGPPAPITDRLLVRDRGRSVFVRFRDIDLIEARGNYALLFVSGARHMMRERMGELQRILEPQGFARIHRSAIVNLDRVKEIVPQQSGDSVVVLHDGTRLRFSRWYRERFESRLAR